MLPKKILFYFLFLSAIGVTCKCSAQDTIWWKQDVKLSWDNFKGTPDTTMGYEALTYSGIDFSYTFTDTSFIFNASTFFNCTKSWKLSFADSGALRHEQLHFDITEVFTRKLRKQLLKLKPERATVQKVIGHLLQQALAEKELMQDQYDQETDFGTKALEQKKWEIKVATILQKS